jgi:hypothetical protein
MCVGCADKQTDNRFRCARARENDNPPPEAGPQQRLQRVGFKRAETQKIGQAGGSLRITVIIFRTINAGVAHKAAKTFGQRELLSSYASKYRRTTGMGAEKFEASLAEMWWFGRHLWHPSDRAMMTRLFHLACGKEQPGERLRDMAWRARGLRRGRREGKTWQNRCTLDGSVDQHWCARSGQLKVRAQRGGLFCTLSRRAVEGRRTGGAATRKRCHAACPGPVSCQPASQPACLPPSRLSRFVSPFAHRAAAFHPLLLHGIQVAKHCST